MDKNYFPGCTCDACRAYIPPNHGYLTQDYKLLCKYCSQKEQK